MSNKKKKKTAAKPAKSVKKTVSKPAKSAKKPAPAAAKSAKKPARAAAKSVKKPAPAAAKSVKKPAPAAAKSVKKPAPAAAKARPAKPAKDTTPVTAATSAPASTNLVAASETAEPTASRSVQLPMVLVILLGVFIWVADVYFVENSGSFHATVYYPETKLPTVVGGVDGKQTYVNYCAACHQPNGKGNRTLNFPPLAGSEWVQAEGPNRLIRIVLNGLSGPIEVSGEQYNNVMLPWKDTMNDDQIAAVLNHIRSSWGNDASEVTAGQVAEIRADTESRPNNWTAAELLKIPVQ